MNLSPSTILLKQSLLWYVNRLVEMSSRGCIMAYIAFFDMVGTRSSASIAEKEYEEAINDFHNAITEVYNSIENSHIYVYSDNAYVQIESLKDTISFFRRLRKLLMFKHRYFSAAVEEGSLNAKLSQFGASDGYSMIFTSPETIKVYLAQNKFSGIGISLSNKVVKLLSDSEELGKSFCSSVFQHKMEPNSSRHYAGIFDVAYDSVGVDELKYVIADYVSTSIMNKSAGRYYITPIISMIKCLDKDTILKEMHNLVKIITFHNLPSAFRSEGTDDQHSILFIYALIETILTLGESDLSIASNAICEQIIKSSQINSDSLIRQLSMVPIDIISGLHKKAFMQIMFSMESEKN